MEKILVSGEIFQKIVVMLQFIEYSAVFGDGSLIELDFLFEVGNFFVFFYKIFYTCVVKDKDIKQVSYNSEG
jgi:hypothetical protein